MKKIAYVELDTHAEIAANFMELMDDSQEFEVDYFFSERIHKQIDKSNSSISLSSFATIDRQLQQRPYDLLIIGTVHRNFAVFSKICCRTNAVVIVHNLNFLKLSKWQLLQNVFKKDFQYRLKLLLKEGLLLAPRVFRNAHHLAVLDPFLANRQFVFLPVFFNHSNESESTEHFTIVIPGTVSQQRRDYFSVIQRLKEADNDLKSGHSTMENRNFQIVFLGKAKGEELVWLKDLRSELKFFDIIFFEEKVPQNQYEEWMKKAHVLWCPVQLRTEFFSHSETYGSTKMSGNIGDAIRYGKMAFFPQGISTGYPFVINDQDDDVFYFKNESRYDFQQEFNKENVRKKLENVLKSLL